MRTPTDYSATPIDPRQLTATDLLNVLNHGEGYGNIGFLVTLIDQEGEPFAEPAQVLFVQDANRAGIAWGGDAVWTDAGSIHQAMQRYLKDEMIG